MHPVGRRRTYSPVLMPCSMLEAISIDRASNVGTAFFTVGDESFRLPTRGDIAEPWAAVRAVNFLVEIEGAVRELVSSLTREYRGACTPSEEEWKKHHHENSWENRTTHT